MQGIGLATLEEIVVEDGVIKNPTFTDYLLPTFLDAPPIEIEVIEEPSSFGPFGAKGVGSRPPSRQRLRWWPPSATPPAWNSTARR